MSKWERLDFDICISLNYQEVTMKFFISAAILSMLLTQVGFCQSGNLSSRVNLIKADTVSKRANVHSTFGSESERDPMIDATLNGMANMMQGMSGYTPDIYSAKQQNAQQLEYVQQQMQNQQMHGDE